MGEKVSHFFLLDSEVNLSLLRSNAVIIKILTTLLSTHLTISFDTYNFISLVAGTVGVASLTAYQTACVIRFSLDTQECFVSGCCPFCYISGLHCWVKSWKLTDCSMYMYKLPSFPLMRRRLLRHSKFYCSSMFA